MTDLTDAEDMIDIKVSASQIRELFEPWDELDSAIEALLVSTRTNSGAPPLVAAVVAARQALRSPLYAIMGGYRTVMAEADRLLERVEELAALHPRGEVFIVRRLFDRKEWESYSVGARRKVGELFRERVDDCLEGFEALGPNSANHQRYRRR